MSAHKTNFYKGKQPGHVFLTGSQRPFVGLTWNIWKVGEKSIFLQTKARKLCLWMDGKTSDKILRRKFKERFGEDLSEEDFVEVVNKLIKLGIAWVNKGYLESGASEAYRERLEKVFDRKRIRPPVFAGLSYSAHFDELRKDIRECLKSVDYDNVRSTCKKKGRLKGIIVPHSNMEFSGPCAAWGYKALSLYPMPDTIIIFGVNHYSVGLRREPFNIIPMDLKTPLGVIKVDRGIIRGLEKRCGFDLYSLGRAHLKEHSIEVQLPFLQHCYKKHIERLRVIPVLCNDTPHDQASKATYEQNQGRFIRLLRKLLNSHGKNVICVASGDLEHQQAATPRRGFHKKNREIIRLLENGDAAFLNQKQRWYNSCGVIAFIPFLMFLNPARGEKLNYSWTYKNNSLFVKKDLNVGQYDHLSNIGYASMAFF